MNLGENIYKYRTMKNLSQGDLADMLSVSRQSISKWENNSATPELDKLVKMSKIFGVSIDALVKSTTDAGENSEEEATYDSSKAEHSNAQPQTITVVKNAGFPGRKIAGTILFCMAFITTLVLGAAGSLGGGLILSIPFLICGLICFLFKKNAGLWCGWVIYFLSDIYMTYGTGINRSAIFNILYYKSLLGIGDTAFINPGRAALVLGIGWIWFSFFFILVVTTVRRFMHKPFPANPGNYIKLAVLAVLILSIVVIQRVAFHGEFLHSLLQNDVSFYEMYIILLRLLDWVKIIFEMILVTWAARYIVTVRKNK